MSTEELVASYYNRLYTSKEICGFLLCVHNIVLSLRQLKRIKRRLGLRRRKQRSPLRDVIERIARLHDIGYAGYGYKLLWRVLNTVCGLSVSQETVRLALRMVDPEGCHLRCRRRLKRRVYYNRGPNFLLHMDGYDKLKPYGIAIHGCIDGFSRKLLWLKAGHSNNNPKLIASNYLEYVKMLQKVPRCIRSDCGTENVIAKDIQIALRSFHGDCMSGIKSFLMGKSPSNQRIERFWSSLNSSFTRFWKGFFEDMVDSGVLNLSDPIHIEALRFCFLPLIILQLDVYMEVWNSHRIRKQINVLSDIPNVMYHQPEVFNGTDCAFRLPCSSETLDNIAEHYSEPYRKFGCTEQFLDLVELITPFRRTDFELERSPEEAYLMFVSIVDKVDEYN